MAGGAGARVFDFGAPSAAGLSATVASRRFISARIVFSSKPVPTWPTKRSTSPSYAASSSAPKPVREPPGAVQPTTTNSSVGSALILSHSFERPDRYGASAFFAMTPSRPMRDTLSKNAAPCASM